MSLNTTLPEDAPAHDHHTVAQVAALLKQALEHQRWKQLDEAERLATEALNLAREELGEKHVTTAYAMTDLAIIQEDLQKPVEARDNLIAALEILEPALGHHHGQVTLIFTRLHHLFM
jgi:tetratricopeptide (TPR) repeat protein